MFKKLKNRLLSFVIILGSCTITTNAEEGIPFNCGYSAYLFQYNDVYAIDLASGNSFQVATDVTSGNINAAAYNPADGYIWGSLTSPEKSIVRIGKNFETLIFYIDELPSSSRYIGDISSSGVYYLKGGGATFYKINLDPVSKNYTQHQATATLSKDIKIHDWAFNAVDNQLYAVEKNSNILYRINPENGEVTSLGEVPVLAGNNYTYGAVYFDVEGRFYVSANQTGTVYVVQAVQNIQSTTDISSNLFAFGPASSSNDGARCPTAPVAQEVCDNGIDDDGDGLIDCEDPSCSGYGQCDIIEISTSGGNQGGLESNNRLSEQINARNFKRAKKGYKFNRSIAPRLSRDIIKAKRKVNKSFALQDAIPFDVIGETEVIESTPSDLVNITNATDIYAVDYMNQDKPFATILALKTEDGVYEHTKYICDRLLGAQLISVSNITINEQSFIKSIIKNIDGSHEFVLSFSAKPVNNDTNFVIESHWNLDHYEENAAFYNFQIWTNTVDNLHLLGKEVLNLLNADKPIIAYNNSKPPTVFVRKGEYSNGALDLQIVNTNRTETATLNAVYRATETSEFETFSSTLNLNGQYITNLKVETGHLFDIGFRINNDISTPDDLFMSDGPWGIDASQKGTEDAKYAVTPNNFEFQTTDFPIERNIELKAITSSYVAAYKVLNPRFKAVDISKYNTFMFTAKGTGNLEITFVKESKSNWAAQFKSTIALKKERQNYTVSVSDFKNAKGEMPELNDVVMMVFTLVSQDGRKTSKTMTLENLRLSEERVLTIDQIEKGPQSLSAYPNPMTFQTTIDFTVMNDETVKLVLYDQLGNQVHSTNHEVSKGYNSITFNRNHVRTGFYFCKIIGSQHESNSLKLIIY